MLVVQIFVMKNGALEGVEMACGDRLVVGPRGADVPLADVDGAGVELVLEGETLLAAPVGGDVRVDGERLYRAVPLTPQSDVVLGAYTLKFRRQPSPRRSQPAPVALALPEALATAPELPTRLAELTTVMQTLAPTDPMADSSIPRDDGGSGPPPWWDGFDDVRDELEEEAIDVDWSLVEALARPHGGAGGRFVEVVYVRGERVLDHIMLGAGEAFTLDGAAVVRRRADGSCALHVPAGGAVRAVRQGEGQDLFAGDAALDVVLASGDAANVVLGERQLLVRFASAPRVSWSREDQLLHRAEQRLQAACTGLGMSLCTLWGGAAWLLDYRDRELVLSLDDDDVTQWQPVELVMTPPELKPEQVREPEPVRDPEPEPESSTRPPAPATAARGGKHAEDAAARALQPLDVLKGLPTLETNRALDLALANVRSPLPARPGGPILEPMTRRGRGADLDIGGSGLSTGDAARGLKRGAGGLGERAARDIGGTVAPAKLRNLKTATEQGLDKDAILRVINEHIGEIAVCYERGLRGDGKLGGRVEVEWIISERGHVAKARLEQATLPSDAVVRCVLDRIKTWRFPKAKTPSIVSYPFSFAAL